MKKSLLLLTLLLVLGGNSMAFDNLRKGFVLGAGIGFSPTVKTEVDATIAPGSEDDFYLGSLSGSEQGLAFQLLFGYGFNEHTVLAYEGDVSWYYYENIIPDDKLNILQGFNSIMLYHYWGSVGNSFFTAAGVGLTYWDTNYTDPNQSELGFVLGAGFEFSPHLQLGAYWGNGKTKNTDFPGVEFEGTHTNLSIVLTAVGY